MAGFRMQRTATYKKKTHHLSAWVKPDCHIYFFDKKPCNLPNSYILKYKFFIEILAKFLLMWKLPAKLMEGFEVHVQNESLEPFFFSTNLRNNSWENAWLQPTF